MIQSLKKFVIAVNGKPFIKGFDRGEVPNGRADFKWKKIKCRSFKMTEKERAILSENISLAIEGLSEVHSEEDLILAINGVTQNMELTTAIIAGIDAGGYPTLSPKDLRNIILGIVDSQMA